MADPPDMTIEEWAHKRNRSVATFYNLKKKGRAPATVDPGVGGPRITAQADRDWEENMKRWAAEDEGRRLAERRSAQARMAGRLGVKSEKHISKRGKRT
jgi:hypothetical protein